MPVTIEDTEAIVAVVPETAAGPGWTNRVIWVHIVDTNTGKYRCEAIQPDEQTPEMKALFDVCEQAAKSLLACVPVMRVDRQATRD